MAEQSLIKYDALAKLSPGKYRVAFESRTAWNCHLVRTGSTVRIDWLDGKSAKQNRQFPLVADSDGHVVATTKPTWGRLARIVTR